MISAEFGWASGRVPLPVRHRDGSFDFFADGRWEESRDWAETWGTQVSEAPDKETQGDKQPEAAPQVPSSRAPVIAMCLAAVAVLIGAATASFLPGFSRSALPDFSRYSPPKANRVAALPPPSPAPVLVPDPVVRAGLRDIQSSEQQNADALQKNADALASLTQSSATQQADLKRITRQLALLTAQVNSLQNQAPQPLTTSSMPPSTTSSIPHPNPRTRVVHAPRKPPPVLAPVPPATLPLLAKPVGPFSVGGAPLSPPPASGSGAS
jgi:hypothetical protein